MSCVWSMCGVWMRMSCVGCNVGCVWFRMCEVGGVSVWYDCSIECVGVGCECECMV